MLDLWGLSSVNARRAKPKGLPRIAEGALVLMAVYSALLTAGLVLSAPWWIVRMLTTQRYRDGLPERLGRVPLRLLQTARGKRVVWVHAVSVGEVLAVSRLVKELEDALGEEACVVISTTTRTGQTLARERFGAERVFYFPLDFGWAVRAYMRLLRPALLVLAESELWPRMLYECERARVPVAVVNARVSDRSFRRAARVGRLWSMLLRKVSLFLAQSESDGSRLIALGAVQDAVRVSGNLKYDIRAPRASRLAELIREIAAGRPVIVAGSTSDDLNGNRSECEESCVLQAWEGVPRQEHQALLVLGPRYPERFGQVESLLLDFAYVKASDLMREATSVFDRFRSCSRIDTILLDTIGDLAATYAVADVAFVGGSLVARGGHNPLEPAQFGVPIVMGPRFENFREIVGQLRAADALFVIEGKGGLEEAMLSLLSDPAVARAMGERGQKVFEQQGGATARTVAALLALIDAKGEPLLERKAKAGSEVRA